MIIQWVDKLVKMANVKEILAKNIKKTGEDLELPNLN
jgi:hypothetical protein